MGWFSRLFDSGDSSPKATDKSSRDEIGRHEQSLNYISVVLGMGSPAVLDGWDEAAGMTRRQKLKRDLEHIANCEDPKIRARAREYLSRL